MEEDQQRKEAIRQEVENIDGMSKKKKEELGVNRDITHERTIFICACSPNELPSIDSLTRDKEDKRILAHWSETICEMRRKWPDYDDAEGEDFGYSYCGDDWLDVLEKLGNVQEYRALLDTKKEAGGSTHRICYGFASHIWPLISDIVSFGPCQHGSNVGDVLDINEEWEDDTEYKYGMHPSPEHDAKYGSWANERKEFMLTYKGKVCYKGWTQRIWEAYRRHHQSKMYQERCPELADWMCLLCHVLSTGDDKMFVDLRRFYSLPEWQVVSIVARYK